MFRPVLVTAPTIAPVTLAQVKSHCRVDHTDDDTLLTALISAAVTYLDGWTGVLGRCLCEQSWRQDFNDFCGILHLPLFPVISITSVKYRDLNGTEQTVAGANYNLRTDDFGSYVKFIANYTAPAVSIEGAAVSVEYKAGYADTAGTPNTPNVPQAICQAMLLLISHWYQNRDAVLADGRISPSVLPIAFDALIAPFRRVKF